MTHSGKGESCSDGKMSFRPEMASNNSFLVMERGERSQGLVANSYTLARHDEKKPTLIQRSCLIFSHAGEERTWT